MPFFVIFGGYNINRIRTYVCFCLEQKLKTKRILRFYFGADSLERALDNLIESKAFDFSGDTVATAERLCAVIDEKMKLERLWAYLDGVILPFSDDDRAALLQYSQRRETPLSESERRAAKRAVVKFTRKALRLGQFGEELAVLKKYFCLIAC